MSIRGSLSAVVAILSPDPDESRELAARIIEDALVPVIAADTADLLAFLDRPCSPDVLLVDPCVPGAGAALARAAAPGGPVYIALGAKPPGQLGVLRPVAASTLSRRLAWALHARGGRSNARDELRTLSSLAWSLDAGSPGHAALREALTRFAVGIGADCGCLALAAALPGGGLTEFVSWGHGCRTPDRAPMPVFSWVFTHQRPLRLARSLDAFPQFAGARLDLPVAEILVAPIVAGEEAVGVLAVGSREPGRLGPEKLAMAIAAGRLLASAVQRDRLERAREHADRLATLGQLATGVAHELSNPLAYVSANLGFLADRLAAAGDDLREILDETREGVRRMIGLVQDLRGAGRRGSGEGELVDLDALARRATVLVGPQFKHRVEFRLTPGGPPAVKAESERLLQILINLLINAGQAMGHHGIAVVRTRAEGPWSLVEVEDDGPGVPEALVSRIFEPFFTTKIGGEGIGLGLSIGLKIARSYGGDILVSEAPGGGARFTLRLPAHAGPAEVLQAG